MVIQRFCTNSDVLLTASQGHTELLMYDILDSMGLEILDDLDRKNVFEVLLPLVSVSSGIRLLINDNNVAQYSCFRADRRNCGTSRFSASS